MIFGRWRPSGAVVASIIFGLSVYLSYDLVTYQIPISIYILQTFPYLITIAVVAGLIGRVRRPPRTAALRARLAERPETTTARAAAFIAARARSTDPEQSRPEEGAARGVARARGVTDLNLTGGYVRDLLAATDQAPLAPA